MQHHHISDFLGEECELALDPALALALDVEDRSNESTMIEEGNAGKDPSNQTLENELLHEFPCSTNEEIVNNLMTQPLEDLLLSDVDSVNNLTQPLDEDLLLSDVDSINNLTQPLDEDLLLSDVPYLSQEDLSSGFDSMSSLPSSSTEYSSVSPPPLQPTLLELLEDYDAPLAELLENVRKRNMDFFLQFCENANNLIHNFELIKTIRESSVRTSVRSQDNNKLIKDFQKIIQIQKDNYVDDIIVIETIGKICLNHPHHHQFSDLCEKVCLINEYYKILLLYQRILNSDLFIHFPIEAMFSCQAMFSQNNAIDFEYLKSNMGTLKTEYPPPLANALHMIHPSSYSSSSPIHSSDLIQAIEQYDQEPTVERLRPLLLDILRFLRQQNKFIDNQIKVTDQLGSFLLSNITEVPTPEINIISHLSELESYCYQIRKYHPSTRTDQSVVRGSIALIVTYYDITAMRNSMKFIRQKPVGLRIGGAKTHEGRNIKICVGEDYAKGIRVHKYEQCLLPPPWKCTYPFSDPTQTPTCSSSAAAGLEKQVMSSNQIISMEEHKQKVLDYCNPSSMSRKRKLEVLGIIDQLRAELEAEDDNLNSSGGEMSPRQVRGQVSRSINQYGGVNDDDLLDRCLLLYSQFYVTQLVVEENSHEDNKAELLRMLEEVRKRGLLSLTPSSTANPDDKDGGGGGKCLVSKFKALNLEEDKGDNVEGEEEEEEERLRNSENCQTVPGEMTEKERILKQAIFDLKAGNMTTENHLRELKTLLVSHLIFKNLSEMDHLKFSKEKWVKALREKKNVMKKKRLIITTAMMNKDKTPLEIVMASTAVNLKKTEKKLKKKIKKLF